MRTKERGVSQEDDMGATAKERQRKQLCHQQLGLAIIQSLHASGQGVTPGL